MENETTAESTPVQASDVLPPKRRRGRPPKVPHSPDDVTTPQPVASGDAPKRRGRPPKARAVPIDTPELRAQLAKQLVGLHLIVAHATGLPELQISEPEGVALADALSAVAREYGLSFSGKTGAALQLFAALAMIYAPRAMAIQKRKSKSAENEPQKVKETLN